MWSSGEWYEVPSSEVKGAAGPKPPDTVRLPYPFGEGLFVPFEEAYRSFVVTEWMNDWTLLKKLFIIA